MLLGVLTFGAVGCGVAPSARISAADVAVPPDPDCVADDYAYFGETTMAALGVSRPSGRPPPDANRVGTIWITADRRVNEGEPVGMAEGRMLCIEFSDPGDEGEISGMTNFPVVDSWQPPGSGDRTEPAVGVPWQLLLAALGAAVLIATSVLAFRSRR